MRQQIKKHRVAIGIVATVLAVIVALIIIGYQFDWTGFGGYNKVTTTHIISGTNAGTVTKTEEYQPGKGLWDWLQLLGILAIPAVVGFGTVWFTTRQTQASEANRAQQAKESEANREKRHLTDLEIAEKNREREQETAIKIAADNQHEAAFRAYLDKMSELLIEKSLADPARAGEQVRNIARVQTLAVLLGLDPIRKGSVLQFLYESALINKVYRIVELSYADLSSANLVGFDKSGANLSKVNLREANLSYANLSGTDLHLATLTAANLFKANLNGANLEKAFLDGADLSFADLSGANFSEAILYNANLKGAENITTEELEKQTKSLKGATMPDGSKHP